MSDTSCSFPTATTCSSPGDGGAPGRANNNNNNYVPPIHPHPHHGLVPFGNHNHHNHHHHHQTELLGGSLGESPDMQVAAVPSHDHDHDHLHLHRGGSSFSTSASTGLPFGSDLMGEAATSQSLHLPSAPHGHGGLRGGGGGPLTLLEELAYMPGGLRSCVFQEEAATPLSADGRHSISSVSSDVSAASPEQQLGGRDVARAAEEEEGRADDVTMGDYVTDDDATPDDVSQLLSQINQNDLIFQQDAGMDDVFSDSVANMSGLPEHFLQNI